LVSLGDEPTLIGQPPVLTSQSLEGTGR
jgi:hypothetical protein